MIIGLEPSPNAEMSPLVFLLLFIDVFSFVLVFLITLVIVSPIKPWYLLDRTPPCRFFPSIHLVSEDSFVA